MDNQFEGLDINEINPEKTYYCSEVSRSTGFTLLMKYMLLDKDIVLMNNIKKYILTLTIEEINKQNTEGWSALNIACRNSEKYCNYEIIKLLLDNKADINMKNNDGWTALIVSSRYSSTDSNTKTVKLLLDYKADLNIKNNNGWTALLVSSRYSSADSNIETIKLLLDYKADINIKNNDGWSALILASFDSNIETVELLLDNKANPNIIIEDKFKYMDIENKILNNNPNKLYNLFGSLYGNKINMGIFYKIIERDIFVNNIVLHNIYINYFNNIYDVGFKYQLLLDCFKNYLITNTKYTIIYDIFIEYDKHYNGIKQILGINTRNIKIHYDVLLIIALISKYKVINQNLLGTIKKCIGSILFI